MQFFCWHKAFISDDFPTLDLPLNATSPCDPDLGACRANFILDKTLNVFRKKKEFTCCLESEGEFNSDSESATIIGLNTFFASHFIKSFLQNTTTMMARITFQID